MKSLQNALSKTLYSLLSTGSTWVDRKRRVMAAKNVGTDAKHQYKQTKSTQNNKRGSCLIFAAVVCVYWYTGLPLVCYMKIFALNANVVDEIFFQILFVWQENDLVFSSVFEKIKLKTTT